MQTESQAGRRRTVARRHGALLVSLLLTSAPASRGRRRDGMESDRVRRNRDGGPGPGSPDSEHGHRPGRRARRGECDHLRLPDVSLDRLRALGLCRKRRRLPRRIARSSASFPPKPTALNAGAQRVARRARTDGQAVQAIAFGEAVAAVILAVRSTDGAAQAQFPYTAPGAGTPGVWVPVGTAPPLPPGWGSVTPWVAATTSRSSGPMVRRRCTAGATRATTTR